MRYCLTSDQYEALYDKLEAEERFRQYCEWVDDGGEFADFRPVDVYVNVIRRIEEIERQRAETVAEQLHEFRSLYWCG